MTATQAPDFVHLHVHTHYSLLDGACRIPEMVQKAAADGQKALAISDHGNLFGAIEFYQACVEQGVKPILGIEAYLAGKSRLQKGDTDDNPTCHITLLARDMVGWRNLMKLSSVSFKDGFYYKPRMDHDVLGKHAEGLIALSGCLSGEVNRRVMVDDHKGALEAAARMRDMFGKDNFFLEIMENGYEPQKKSTAGLARLSEELGIPLCATNDVHYLHCEDADVQDVALCISTGKKVSDENRMRMGTNQLYFKTRAEMGQAFAGHREALESTVAIASRIDLKLDFKTYHLPVFQTGTGEATRDMFRRLCREGALRRYGGINEAVQQRLDYEMQVIEKLGFVDYFLIVSDFIRYGRENGVPVGPGRGSAAGSLVAYVLGIADVDPLRYKLLFERFLNSERISMPDIDIDFCRDGREKVIEYVRRKYGDENVCQIITFGTMASRGVLRDVGRVLDLPLQLVDKIAKKIPQGPGASLGKALENDADVKALYAESETNKQLFDYGLKLEGLARHASTHAAGVVISDKPLTEYVPLYRNGDEITTQWQMEDIEKVGLLKMDFLGLKTLTIIQTALDLVRKTRGTDIPIDQLPLDDAKTFAHLCSGDTLGVFQLESSGMRELLVRLRPDKFEDLIALLALYRPGPLGSGMVDMYVRRKHGEEAVEYGVECLRSLLEETYGVIVYQEQVMLIASELSGFSLNEADNLRKAMGKKKPEVMAKFKEKFIDGAVQKGHDRGFAKKLFEDIEYFAGYGFNKSHSTAYALITYRTAWLKANYPLEFMCANLTCDLGRSDKVKEWVDESRRMGLRILGPDVNRCDVKFGVEDGAIRYGLAALKGVGERACENLVAERQRGGPFLHLEDLCERLDGGQWNKAALEVLATSGALLSLGINRATAAASLELAMKAAESLKRDRKRGQKNLFAGPGAAAPPAGGGKSLLTDLPEWNEKELLAREKDALGFYFSGHPFERRGSFFRKLAGNDTASIATVAPGESVVLAGMINSVKVMVIKSGRNAGQKMAKFRLEDLSGAVSATVFARTYAEVKDRIVEDAIVFVRGKLETGAEEAGILVEQIVPTETVVRQSVMSLMVALRDQDVEDDTRLDRLAQILGRYRGDRTVFLDVPGENGRIRVRADSRFSVEVTEPLIDELAEAFGPTALSFGRN